MNLKQWKTLEKCRKLGNAGGYLFVRDNNLYAGNNYAGIRLYSADMLTGAVKGTNAGISVELYPKKTSDKVEIKCGVSVENLRNIDKVFAGGEDEVSRPVNPDFLKMMTEVAKNFEWFVHVTGVGNAMHGTFVDKGGFVHGDFVIMGVRLG